MGALACGVVKYVRYVSHVHYRFVFCKSRSNAALPLHHLHHPPRTTYYLVLTDGNDNHKNDVVGPYRYCCYLVLQSGETPLLDGVYVVQPLCLAGINSSTQFLPLTLKS